MPHEEDHGFWTGERERSHTGPIPRLMRTPRPAIAKPGRRHAGNDFVDDSFSGQAYSRQAWSAHDARDHDLNGHDLNDHDLDDRVWNDDARAGNRWIIRRPDDRRPNFALRRIGALVALGVVAIPVAVVIGGSDDRSPQVAAAAETAVVQPFVEPGSASLNDAAAVVTVAVQHPATSASSAASTTTAVLVAASASSTAATATTAPPSAAIGIGATPPAQVRTEADTTDTAATVDASTAVTAIDGPVADTVVKSCVSDYEIVQGDYWIQIAAKVSVRLADVLQANGATVDTPLYPGRTICLPANASAPATDPATSAAPTATAAPTTTVKATTTTVQPTSTTNKSTSTSGTAAQAPSTTAAPPKNTYTRAQVEQIIRDVWPDDLEDEAIRIATPQSNLVPTVRNSCCFGLFQLYWNVHKDWIAEAGVASSAQLYDPLVNTYLAFAMYVRAGGWGPWT